ncbi:hypothetical protein QYM36_016503 [Artemia franciscana]|nr:hypothetical protein QYM36_016503 [Artemia franciscana]KAK2706485.1 hypothetical protein QYM36_016503 [Artemia franciscana]
MSKLCQIIHNILISIFLLQHRFSCFFISIKFTVYHIYRLFLASISSDYTTLSGSKRLGILNKELKVCKKTPVHVGLIICEDSISFYDLNNIIFWLKALGIQFVSVHAPLMEEWQGEVQIEETCSRNDIKIYCCQAHDTVHSIQKVTTLEKDVNADQAMGFLLKHKSPEPELVLQFGLPGLSLGYSPLKLRFSTIV